jgi:assimilatory nitrate reductase catalytic subunit
LNFKVKLFRNKSIDYLDRAAGRYRGAAIVEGRLGCCIFIAQNHQLPLHSWLAGLFARPELAGSERAGLLTGRPGKGQVDMGRVVCACFNVGLNTLVKAIRDQRLTSPEQIGAVLKAGTNCGSCVPELCKLLTQSA